MKPSSNPVAPPGTGADAEVGCAWGTLGGSRAQRGPGGVSEVAEGSDSRRHTSVLGS